MNDKYIIDRIKKNLIANGKNDMGRLQNGTHLSSMSPVYGHSIYDLPFPTRLILSQQIKRSTKMKSLQFLTKAMMVMSLLVFAGASNLNAQHMGDNHQDTDPAMGGDQPTQHMHENMQNMQQMQQTNMMGMDGQGMMMSLEEMTEHMGQLMDHSEAMMSSMESGGLMAMFRGDNAESHMMDMSQDMSDMMEGMQGLMENMQTMMGDQSMMSQPGMQNEMDHMQATLSEMVGSMDQMMDNMHKIQKINPKLKAKN